MVFEELIRTHQGAVRTFLRRLTGDATLADDFAQDTLIIAYQRLSTLQNTNSVRPWLFKIAYRRFLDHRKKFRRRGRLDELLVDSCPEAPPSGMTLDLQKAMNKFTPNCRAVVILCLGHGLTHIEAAEITGLPLGTVKSYVKRGKEKLQVFLKAYAT